MDRVTILVRHDDTEPDSSVAERQVELAGDIKYLRYLVSDHESLGKAVRYMANELLDLEEQNEIH